jgi:phosphate transport system substrate-binding protein
MRSKIARAILIALLAGPLAGTAALAADTLRIGGSGSAIGAIKSLGVAFSSDHGINGNVIPSLGSTGGIRAVADGLLDIGVSARPLRPEEAARGLMLLKIARSPFCLVTSHRNHSGLKSVDIPEIYRSKNSHWTDGTPIRIILRPKSDSDTMLLIASFPGIAEALDQARARSEVPVAANDQDNADMAERISGSFTAIALTQMITEKRNLRLIAIDGAEPTLANMENGSYPYAWTMYFVLPATKSPKVEKFLAFVRSPQGQKILRETGNLPVSP